MSLFDSRSTKKQKLTTTYCFFLLHNNIKIGMGVTQRYETIITIKCFVSLEKKKHKIYMYTEQNSMF